MYSIQATQECTIDWLAAHMAHTLYMSDMAAWLTA